MGLIKGLVKMCVKTAAAPLYIPYKAVKELKKVKDQLTGPSNYFKEYHDSGLNQE